MTSTSIGLDTVEREAFRHSMQDGLMLVFLGVIMFGMAVLYTIQPALGGMAAVAVVILPPVSEKIRERFVYPRIGYVKTKIDGSFDLLPFLVFLGFVFTMSGLIIPLFPGGYSDVDNLFRTIPFALGMIMFGPSLFLQEKTGQDRYMLIGVATTITGLLVTVVSVMDDPWPAFDGIRVWCLIWGIGFFLTGMVIFGLFLMNNPVLEDEGTE